MGPSLLPFLGMDAALRCGKIGPKNAMMFSVFICILLHTFTSTSHMDKHESAMALTHVLSTSLVKDDFLNTYKTTQKPRPKAIVSH